MKRRTRRPLLQAEIELAIKNSKSAKGAARFLGVSYNTFKKYAQMYKNEADEVLFETCKNPTGKGIKHIVDYDKKYPLDDILAGQYPHYKDWRLKDRLVRMGYLEESCHNCGYCEKRVTDEKIPLILEYRDEDIGNRSLENLYLLCYNCHFQLVGALNWKGWRQNIWYDAKGNDKKS
jgi:5-methylcytosine-specific restriction endonuclease McrA